MKALVLEEYNRLVFKDEVCPEPAPEEVLVQVKACGICGSDVHGFDGSTGRRRPPVIMGHEAAGIIAGKGSSVTGWENGDRVTFDSTRYCGECFFCRKGMINLCDNRMVFGVSCEEYRCNGAFAEYVAVPQDILYRLPDNLEFKHAALVEPLSVAFHAVERTGISINDTAVVVGTGMIGLLLIQALRLAGCGKIIAVDIDQGRLELASKFGADTVLNPSNMNSYNKNIVEKILELTKNCGADVAFEAVGIGGTVSLASNCLRKGGKITLVGNLSAEVLIPLQRIVTCEITVKGSCASSGEYPACLDMIARGSIDVESLISGSAPLSEGAEWFDRLYKKERGLLKILLIP